MVFTTETLLSDLSSDEKTNWRFNEEIIANVLSRQPRYRQSRLIPLIQSYGYYAEGEKEIGGIRLEKKLDKTTWGKMHKGSRARIVRCDVCHEINSCLKSFDAASCQSSQNNLLCLHTGMAGTYPLLEASIRILAGRYLLDIEESGKMIAILRCYGQVSLMLDRAVGQGETPDPMVGRLLPNPHVHRELLAKRGQEALEPISRGIVTDAQNFIGAAIRNGIGSEVPYVSLPGLQTSINVTAGGVIAKAMNLIPETPQISGRLIDQF